MDDVLKKLLEEGRIGPLDAHFGDYIQRESGGDAAMGQLAAIVSRRIGDGSVCINLGDTEFRNEVEAGTGIKLPGSGELKELIVKHSKVIGMAGEAPRPLMCRGEMVYLNRYLQYENCVISMIKDMVKENRNPPAGALAVTEGCFKGHVKSEGIDLQRLAVFASLGNRFTILSGGPGTGKTFTVARIIAAYAEQAAAAKKSGFIIKLAAPTGKAAMRMRDSIRQALMGDSGGKLPGMELSPSADKLMPKEAYTLHRLLGHVSGSPYFRHNRKNRLDADLVVVDEVSMASLPMLAKLMEALKPGASLVLVGDMDQLASVDAGNVYGDICRAAVSNTFSSGMVKSFCDKKFTGDTKQLIKTVPDSADKPWYCGCVIKLVVNYRSGSAKHVADVSRELNDLAIGDAGTAAEIYNKYARPANEAGVSVPGVKFSVLNLPAAGGDKTPSRTELNKRIKESIQDVIWSGYKDYLVSEKAGDAFTALRKFTVLCATKAGPPGVENINSLIEEILEERSKVEKLTPAFSAEGIFYDHMPVMITVNDYSQRLFNGDIGIVLKNKESGKYYAYFETTEEKTGAESEKTRPIPVSLLPEHQTAFAMTIHKSQGSEFGKVLVIMPPDDNEKLFTRELLYTAITRAKNQVEVWCPADVFEKCVNRRINRSSGLKEALQEKGAPASKRKED